MATRKLIVYPNKDLMIQAGAQRFVLALLDLLAERLPDGTHRTRGMWRCLAVRPRSRWAWC